MDPILQQFAEFLNNQVKVKAPANYNTAQLLQQPGGIWNVAGMDNMVVSTHIAPQGLGSVLPAFPDDEDDPRFGFLFGFSDDIGSEPTYPCEDAPTGYMKMGTLTAAFGRIVRQTDTIEIDATLHKQRGAVMNLAMMNEMLSQGSIVNPEPNRNVLDTVTNAQMAMVGVRMERVMAKLLWRGSPANNTAGGGYREFPGLDNQIATGHLDAENGTAIPSADSYIDDFLYNAVDGTTLDIVERLSYMEYFLDDLATRTNMNPMTWALVMRPQLFFELTAVWACRYLSNRCSDFSSGAQLVSVNDDTAVQMRDAMRNGKYLIVNGKQIPVVLDDGIVEKTNTDEASIPSGQFASSIYMVPLRAKGSFPVTYWQYIDYRNIQAQLAALGAGQRNVPFWTDGGTLLWVYRENGYCFDLQAKIEPRCVLRTPHLAGKIQNIRYSPLRHLRDFDAESPYWVNGGTSVGTKTQGYAVWR